MYTKMFILLDESLGYKMHKFLTILLKGKFMKIVFMLAILFAGTLSFAQTESVINFMNFKHELTYENNIFSEDSLGEVEDLGGECFLTLVPSQNGFSEILFSIDNVVRFKVLIEETAQIKRTFYGDESYSVNYTWGGYASLSIVHADDAYDTITLSNSSTTLTCGAYY